MTVIRIICVHRGNLLQLHQGSLFPCNYRDADSILYHKIALANVFCKTSGQQRLLLCPGKVTPNFWNVCSSGFLLLFVATVYTINIETALMKNTVASKYSS